MVMSELDRLSLEIGRLQAGNETAREERSEIRKQLRDIVDTLGSLNLGISDANRMIADMYPKVEASARSRWTTRGVLAAIAVMGGFGGAKALAVLGWLTGK